MSTRCEVLELMLAPMWGWVLDPWTPAGRSDLPGAAARRCHCELSDAMRCVDARDATSVRTE